MFKNAEVVMLPTNQKSNIYQTDRLYSYIKGVEREPLNCDNQHLYIISEEPIKKGEWAIASNNTNGTITDFEGCEPFIAKSDYAASIYVLKIIATTDKSLKIIGHNISYPILGQTIIPLPEPSKSFIDIYIKEFNNNTPIIKILVEYYSISCDGLVNYSYRDTENHSYEEADEVYICSTCNTEYRNPGFNYGKQRTCYKRTAVLKVDSKDNTITIKKVINNYTPEEVKSLTYSSFLAGISTYSNTKNKELAPLTVYNNWKKENL